MVFDDKFFSGTVDPHQAWWAKNDIFSFARVDQYLDAFRSTFKSVWVMATLSEEGLAFKRQFPDAWKRLLERGNSESDLMTKGLTFICQK
jgi:hypothetical protein